MQDDAIDRLLAEAAANPPTPSPALINRVLADGLALQPAAPVPPRRVAVAGPGLVARLVAVFGGAPALAGISAAVLGIAFGYLNPATIDSLGLTGGMEEFVPTVDVLVTEG